MVVEPGERTQETRKRVIGPAQGTSEGRPRLEHERIPARALEAAYAATSGELFQDLVLLGHAFPPKADDSGGQNVEGPRAGDPELREAPGYERGHRRTEQPNRDDQEKGMRLS